MAQIGAGVEAEDRKAECFSGCTFLSALAPLRTSVDVRHCSASAYQRTRYGEAEELGRLGLCCYPRRRSSLPRRCDFRGGHAIRQKDDAEAQRDNASGNAKFRKFYSPQISNDPYVQDQWRKGVEALEAQCLHTGQRCAEAKAARRWLSEKR